MPEPLDAIARLRDAVNANDENPRYDDLYSADVIDAARNLIAAIDPNRRGDYATNVFIAEFWLAYWRTRLIELKGFPDDGDLEATEPAPGETFDLAAKKPWPIIG
jgi:hypothetical protein